MTTLGTAEQQSTETGATTPTVAQVLAWQPSTLTTRGDAWSAQASKLTSFDDTQYRAVDAGRDFWTGSAADAMRTRHDEIRTTTRTVIAALQDGATAAKTGASRLDSAKTAVVDAVKSAESKGYEIGDDGTATISASTHQTLLSQLPDASSYSVAAGALQVDADASTAAVKQALENACTAAAKVQSAIESAFVSLPEADSFIVYQNENRSQHTESDAAGRAILIRYLKGMGDWTIVDDPKWSEYMMANEVLRRQLDEPVATAAASALQGYLQNGNSSQPGTPQKFHAEMENGESMVGYQYLHGTDETVGDFTFRPNSVVTPRGDGTYEIKMYNSYTWNDIINENPKYQTDQVKNDFAELISLGKAEEYKIKITWNADATVIVDESGKVISMEGYPAS
ncbi:WXG100 family type VII secretion target [Nocardia sp. NPDC058176]|uniref:WXG100 family type VII secretion target n=1 Tax=Nocardia sp. NPDC058176 TaxID=3346368 RepID=UPI0036DA97F9